MSDDAESIRQRMQFVRRSVGDDVEGLVRTAKTLSDWRYYVRNHPWACLGAALAAGFLMVPKRKLPFSHDTKQLLELLKRHDLSFKSGSPESGKGLAMTLLGLAAPALLRGVMTYAGNRFSSDRSAAAEATSGAREHEDL